MDYIIDKDQIYSAISEIEEEYPSRVFLTQKKSEIKLVRRMRMAGYFGFFIGIMPIYYHAPQFRDDFDGMSVALLAILIWGFACFGIWQARWSEERRLSSELEQLSKRVEYRERKLVCLDLMLVLPSVDEVAENLAQSLEKEQFVDILESDKALLRQAAVDLLSKVVEKW